MNHHQQTERQAARPRLDTEYRALYGAVRRWKARIGQARGLERIARSEGDILALAEAKTIRAQAEAKHEQAIRVALGGIRRIARKPITRPSVLATPASANETAGDEEATRKAA